MVMMREMIVMTVMELRLCEGRRIPTGRRPFYAKFLYPTLCAG